MIKIFYLIKDLLWQKTFLKKLLNFPAFSQFIKFSLVGLLNTAIDFSVYVGLTRTIFWFAENYLIANALSFAIASTNSFFLNKNWTFGNKQKGLPQYLGFLGVCLSTLILVEIILYLLVNGLGIYDLYAKILVLIISVISNFLLSKLLVFKV